MVIVKNQKKGIEIDKGTIVCFISKEEALARMYKVVIKGQEKISKADEKRKNTIEQEVLQEVVWEFAMILLEVNPAVELPLPGDWALFEFDALNALISKIYIESNQKLPCSYLV